MELLALRTVTDCPVCHRPGYPPSVRSTVALDVYHCHTSGCPVMSFLPVEPDLDES